MARRALAIAGLLLAAAAAGARGGDALAALPELHSGGLRVYLVRHGQALSNLAPPPDLPPAGLDHLTELGRQQAAAAGKTLAGRGVSAVFSSPTARARETAELLATALGTRPPGVDERLGPMLLGSTRDGRPLAWDERIADWAAGRDPTPVGGESMARVGHRVGELVRALARSRRGTQVVLVAHSEVIGAYLGRVRGTLPAKRYPPGITNGSISVVDVGPTGAEEVRLASHVPEAP
jgi:probable phosphoglycerate mutase